MMTSRRRSIWLLVLLAGLLVASELTAHPHPSAVLTPVAPAEPCAEPVPDLPALKDQLVAYHDSGRYADDLRAVVARARAYLEAHLDPARKQAIVLDVDETSLSNWPEIVGVRFGYERASWNRWVERAEALAIGPTLELYNFAKANGVAVFFITGRREHQRAATERNLAAAGYADWDGLTLKPDDSDVAFAAIYKAAARKRLVEQGYQIVLTLGDQQSDLSGGFADATFKLPNPFYRVP